MSPQSIADTQLDLFARGADRDAGLDAGLWTRRHDRRDQARGVGLLPENAIVSSLVLALARLAAQRDARLIVHDLQPQGQT